jgi:hypothetical protein
MLRFNGFRQIIGMGHRLFLVIPVNMLVHVALVVVKVNPG